ncbi:16S rRNA (cytidine(1402)-2'-O)-methyltransferase [Mesomycoplasma ovipneumoniae]|uniref:16S rRNA (cytidine(1402)-2'-O)-methyltransferase n=1 Tax=Mesomycoplasma ovipneumoniae TaxID=29562 RepID=UPI00083E7439|nr:16S rRNA (cytidine(1402)-2'-O)-methyltransferase [Mesomycoplasma ovipneumoniae]MDO6825958.1 16S rRNA (cytidine(1402)-2'-O)-methyltransferase [Mesomycoplasma ovipneumoniae]MDW2909999.1 16S rRNA (cytidine(1402)-2'-O)-methyltransferase [Mesomycoplasma ovipneumoniae]MDW2910835.1 16S rRNA (cytidine(1402)-2'-O)-methyltransferase [Mesomycoplasma ovipneumoniae]MDW2914811.1 16S rRNA (cytidine(1402)-2'-O)-methyltransferase [Mesomycoplasma ovipneumoniae]MDW2915723.1 16S rRNA (cytidine(1402)-2'-O)-meth
MAKITVIATPIGNLQDITLRAIQAIKSADLILCEDTRTSKKILNFLEVKDKKLISYHKFNEKSTIAKMSDIFLTNKNIILMSDAGTPSISDPGQILIKWAHQNDVEVDFLPGACAFVGAFVLSGFDLPLVFMGFFNSKKQQIIKQIEHFIQNYSYIFYVSPYKLLYILEVINEFYGDKVEIFLVKEMTKIHQKYFFGSPLKVLGELQNSTKGEFTMVLRLKNDEKPKLKANKYENFSKNSVKF